MAAESQFAPKPQAEQPPVPAQAAPQENLLKKDFGEGGLRGAEQAAEKEGMEKLNEMGKNLNLQAEAGAQEFGQQTKSWWERTKDRFRKKEDTTPLKGEAEVLKEIEKADAVYAEFKKKYDDVMASGDEAALRGMESSLSQAYEQLAPKVAEEGAAESKQLKQALKTGEMPQITETGAKLNDVTRRLMEVRGRLAPPAPEAEEPIFTKEERAQLRADVAKYQPPSAPENPLKKDFGEGGLAGAEQAAFEKGRAILENKPAASAEQAPRSNETQAQAPAAERQAGKPAAGEEAKAERAHKDAAERSELEKMAAGTPGEKMVGEYLKLRKLKEDQYGRITGHAFDPRKGEIRLTYEDGSSFRKYATGMMLRIHPGGKVEEIKHETVKTPEAPEKKPQAVIVEEEPEAEDQSVDVDLSDLEEAPVEGVVSGEVDVKPEPPEPLQEPSVIVSPDAANPDAEPNEDEEDVIDMVDIGGGNFVSAAEAARMQRKPKELPPAPAEAEVATEPAAEAAPEAKPEKQESPLDAKLGARVAAEAARLLQLKASKEDKLAPSKELKRLRAADPIQFLKELEGAGVITSAEMKAAAMDHAEAEHTRDTYIKTLQEKMAG